MAVGNALFTTVELKEELSFGVKDTATDGAELLPRISFNPKLDQSIIQSNEIKRSMQTANYDRGMKASSATLKGELEAGSYKTLFSALLKQNFNTGVVSDITGIDISAAPTLNNLGTTGSDWTIPAQLQLAIGDTIKFNGFTGANAPNNNRLWILIAAGPSSMTLRPKDGNYVMFTQATGDAITVSNLGTDDVPKNKVITRSNISSVADTAIFTTIGGNFTAPFNVGNVVKVSGFTGTNAPNNEKPFHITKITATTIFGYYTDGSLALADAAGESVTITKLDNVRINYATTNSLAIATQTSLTSTSSFIAEGFKIHDVIQLRSFTTATNNNRNLLIKSFNAAGTTLSFSVLDNDAVTTPIVPESGISGASVVRAGSKCFIPQENHTDKSFMIEKWFSNINQSEQYTGMKVNMAKISAPSSAIPTVDFDFIGKDLETAQTHYYTSSAAPEASENLSAIFGTIFINGVNAGCITAFDLSINADLSSLDKCIGTDSVANIVPGIYKVEGSMSLYFSSEVQRDRFLNKNELSLVLILRESDAFNADFMAFSMPRIVYNSASIGDDIKASVLTIPFTAFENPTGNDGTDKQKNKSMISIQDSKAI
jgi:hypothetical protein